MGTIKSNYIICFTKFHRLQSLNPILVLALKINFNELIEVRQNGFSWVNMLLINRLCRTHWNHVVMSTLQCTKPYTAEDIIVLNGDDADFELMKTKMEARRLAAKQSKRGKKKAKADMDSEPAAKLAKAADKPKAKPTAASVADSKITKARPLSVQQDPTASETYKSLFTSSSAAKKQGAQHSGWVSFNPQYFR